MGVDIYGRKPQIKSDRPELDFSSASSAAKDAYFEAMYEWEDENPGYYFRSNWWGWRPIVAMVDAACLKADIDVDTSGWHSNDAEGPETQEQCNEIANALEAMINSENSPMKNEDDAMFLCIGSWCTPDGKFISDAVQEELNKEYPVGSILTSSVVASDGTLARPAHGTYRSRVEEFILFLRNCGGFQVY
jgi:hypothetical protein